MSVDTGAGDGTIRLDVLDYRTIQDAATNALQGGFTASEKYTLDGLVLEFSTISSSFVVTPGGTLAVTATVSASPETVAGFQLNFAQSAIAPGQLHLHEWSTSSEWSVVTDGTLGTPSDTFVSAASLSTAMTAPVELGRFEILAPNVTVDTDFLLTVNSLLGGAFDTHFTSTSSAIRIADYADAIIQVRVDSIPPTVDSVEVNAGLTDPPDRPGGMQPTSWENQRSDIRTIEVTFSEEVAVTPSDLKLTNLGKNADVEPDAVIPLTEGQLNIVGRTLTISFTSYELPDGIYQLEILADVQDAAGNLLDGNADGIGGDSFVITGDSQSRLHKLAGDYTGDGAVSIHDWQIFVYWFGPGEPAAPDYMDLNSDGGVSIPDLPTFKGNFGPENSLVFPQAAAALMIGSAAPSSEFSEADDGPAFATPHVTASVPDVTNLPTSGPMDHQPTENSPTISPPVRDDSSRLDKPLTEEALTVIVDAAITRWGDAGVTAEEMSRLEAVEVRIDDLGHELGRARSELVLIDDDGAGCGWFVDPTPDDDCEFDDRRRAPHESPAWGQSDLLTVVIHELGHVLGREHVDADQDPDGLMRETLDVSTRRLPFSADAPLESAAIDGFFGTVFEAEESLLPFDA